MRFSARYARVQKDTSSSSSRRTLTATCAVLTAAIHFDNYSDANGYERCVFSGDPHRVGEQEDGRGRKKSSVPLGASRCANASPPSRTHS